MWLSFAFRGKGRLHHHVQNTLPFRLDVESAYPSALEAAEVEVEVVDHGGDCAVTGHPEFLQGVEAHWIQGVLGAEGRKADGADGATGDVGQPGPEVGPTFSKDEMKC